MLVAAEAQRPQRGERPNGGGITEGAPGAGMAAAGKLPKSYKEVITEKAETMKGLLTKYHYKDLIGRISPVIEGKGD